MLSRRSEKTREHGQRGESASLAFLYSLLFSDGEDRRALWVLLCPKQEVGPWLPILFECVLFAVVLPRCEWTQHLFPSSNYSFWASYEIMKLIVFLNQMGDLRGWLWIHCLHYSFCDPPVDFSRQVGTPLFFDCVCLLCSYLIWLALNSLSPKCSKFIEIVGYVSPVQ